MTTHYKNPRIYIIVTYVVFWLGIFLTGGIYILSKNDVVMTLGTILLSWVPTIVVLIFFNKLVPNANRTNWIKEAFTSKIKTGMVAAVTLAFTLSVVFTYIIMLHRSSDVSIIDFKSLSISSITLTVFNAIITGATGEELGWRGYLQRYFEESSNGNVIKSSLKVSLVWSFWHTPLWIVSSAGQPMDYLLNYIITFIILNICTSVIIAICYNYCRNLFVPMWIHFIFNLFMSLVFPCFTGNFSMMEGRCWLVLFYLLIAISFALWDKMRHRIKWQLPVWNWLDVGRNFKVKKYAAPIIGIVGLLANNAFLPLVLLYSYTDNFTDWKWTSRIFEGYN